MNNYSCIGRLTRDIEVKEGNNGCYTQNTVAIDNGRDDTLFLPFTAFGKQAEILEQYCKKGSKVGLAGRLEANSYEKQDGTKVEGTKMTVNSVSLVEKMDDGEKRNSDNSRRSEGSSGRSSGRSGGDRGTDAGSRRGSSGSSRRGDSGGRSGRTGGGRRR